MATACLLSAASVAAHERRPDFILKPAHARQMGLNSLRQAVRQDGGVPLPPNLNEFIKDKKAAIQLGKAFFWDMQVGADGVTACASCHFHAGADGRSKNSLSPNLISVANKSEGPVVGYMNAQKVKDTMLRTRKLNEQMQREDFPLIKQIESLVSGEGDTLRPGPRNSNNIVGSMGTMFTHFDGIEPGFAVDKGTPLKSDLWTIGGDKRVRQVGHRNAPSVINAIFNFSNFADGHSNPFFNGQHQFGIQHDPIILVNDGEHVVLHQIQLAHGSLAGQTTQPATEPNEMAYGDADEPNFRNLPDIGRKMLGQYKATGLALRPLALQRVHPTDSVLGPLSRWPKKGLNVDGYEVLIKRAFQDKYWNSPEVLVVSETEQLTQMQGNFALFFGLAIQLYEATLVSDMTPFDQWMETGRLNRKFNVSALMGLNVFAKEGRCIACHAGPELSTSSVRQTLGGTRTIEAVKMYKGFALRDVGFYNIGVTPTSDDIGRGNTDFKKAPISFARQALMRRLDIAPIAFQILGNEFINAVEPLTGERVCDDTDKNGYCGANEAILPAFHRVAVDGAFKAPGLRNSELTGPYFHNGGAATLRQVVQFFNRGGNFCRTNAQDLSPEIRPLHLSSEQERWLVAFLMSLTDERVRYSQAPFDHPELMLPVDGTDASASAILHATGKEGSSKPLGTFLGLHPQDPIFTPTGLCQQ